MKITPKMQRSKYQNVIELNEKLFQTGISSDNNFYVLSFHTKRKTETKSVILKCLGILYDIHGVKSSANGKKTKYESREGHKEVR